MDELKVKIRTLVDARSISIFLGLAGATMLVPFFIHLQWLTGPFVNAMLIVTLFILGIRSALLLCLIPSLMALSGGLIPAFLAPTVPFIMLSNVIYVLCIDWIYNNSKNSNSGCWWGILAGSSAKFLFLLFSMNFIARIMTKSEWTVKVAQMFSWPQFATAIAGGAIAWMILKWLKRI